MLYNIIDNDNHLHINYIFLAFRKGERNMMKPIKYITIDGRGDHDTFRDCITKAIHDLKPGEGIHVIKDFEPFPLYEMMNKKGFDKYIEKISDVEYHAYFSPKEQLERIKMGEHLDMDDKKIKKILKIKLDFLKGNITLEAAKEQMHESVETVTAQEFAICEQYLEKFDISDDMLAERMDEVIEIFDGILVSDKPELPSGHPIKTYQKEVTAIRNLLEEMRSLLPKKFIKNPWCEVYDKLAEINVHFSRKQNQLYPALESKGFDKPSKVMWTLENSIRDIIKKARGYLDENQDEAFMKLQQEVIEMVEDMMVKEVEILFPTAINLLTHEDFVKMRIGDDEIGYCLIGSPAPFPEESKQPEEESSSSELLKDLSNLLQKHGILGNSSGDVLHVSQGKLTLEQINLIFKHLQVDLSYVDEDEVVKFYSDTKHRVFPRSAGVIGRKVQNCHPSESVDTVEEIIRAFRAGEQDEAEFWLEMGDKFIYIIYNAVRDDEGRFRGVLEMMQDVTHIRSLTGSQRLLSWNNGNKKKIAEEGEETIENGYGIQGDTKVGNLVKEYPFIKDFLYNLSPKYNKLKNPVIFKAMSSVATIEMISERGGFKVNELIDKIVTRIKEEEK